MIATMTQLNQLYALYTLLHFIKTLLFLMYVPVVFVTVGPDDNGQRSADEDHRLTHKLLLHHQSKLSHLNHLIPLPVTTAIWCRFCRLVCQTCSVKSLSEEVEEHNSTHQGAPVVDPSEELIGVFPYKNKVNRWIKKIVILCSLTSPVHSCAWISYYIYYNSCFNNLIILVKLTSSQIYALFSYTLHWFLGLAVSTPNSGRVDLCSSPKGGSNLTRKKNEVFFN
jgi:hypothetical protein